ncbi:hypothetical protein [Streptomyces sp. NPDC046985]|uniref:hypothetical protein n=1 Tax=Streptomyces sp. NPDC046985 TaxID=3155377 RepID=UPI0033D325AC
MARAGGPAPSAQPVLDRVRARLAQRDGQAASHALSVWRLPARSGLAVFLAVSAVFSLMTPVLTYAVALWISRYTYPHDAWPVGIPVTTNAVIVIVQQVPVGRTVDRRERPEAVTVPAGVTLGAGLTTVGLR